MLVKGTRFAGYEIEGVLGRGGMGVVYEATQLSLSRTVALKLLATELSDEPGFRERFRREGLIQAALDHPSIVTVYEAGEVEHGLFLVMRLVRGGTLKEKILAGELDAERSLRILAPVADALDSAHASGLIHRDIKPQNVLVAGRDHPYLSDFGLTKPASERGLTRTGMFVGTLDYGSPEQINGQATASSDIYSLAAVLYECLTGIVPYPRGTEAAVIFAHMAEPPPRVSDRRPELPAELDDVIARALSKQPEERHGSASELIFDAGRALGEDMRTAVTPWGAVETGEAAGVRRPEPELDTEERRARGFDTPAAPTKQGPSPVSTPAEPVEAVRAEAPPTRAPPARAPGADGTSGRVLERTHRREANGVKPTFASPRRPPTPAIASPAGAAVADEAVRDPASRVRDWGRRVSPSLLVTVLVAAAAGYFSGGSTSQPAAAPKLSSASTRDLALTFPDSWRRLDGAPEIPGLRFRDPLAFAPGDNEAGGGLVAGQLAATGPTLLPQPFLDRLAEPPPRDDAVRLGRLQAYRYRDLEPRGYDRALTLYVVPNSKGVATIGCFGASSGADASLAECARIAASLELDGAAAYPLGPGGRYAQTLETTIERLAGTRDKERSRLRSAKTPAGQRSAATALASAYAAAAEAMAKTSTSPADRDAHSSLVAALRRAESGYSAIASAARRDDDASYRAATAEVRRGEADLQRALRSLRRNGYRSASA